MEKQKFLLAFFVTILLLMVLLAPTIQNVRDYFFGPSPTIAEVITDEHTEIMASP